MDFGVHMHPKWVHMEAEGRPNGGLGAKPPEKGPLAPIGPYWRYSLYLGCDMSPDWAQLDVWHFGLLHEFQSSSKQLPHQRANGVHKEHRHSLASLAWQPG